MCRNIHPFVVVTLLFVLCSVGIAQPAQTPSGALDGLRGGAKVRALVELVVEDNESKAEAAVKANTKMITQDDVMIIIGPQASSQAVPAGGHLDDVFAEGGSKPADRHLQRGRGLGGARLRDERDLRDEERTRAASRDDFRPR